MKTLEEELLDRDLCDLHEMPSHGGKELDEEDADELMCEIQELLEELSQRKLPKGLTKRIHDLLTRVDEVLAYYDIH